MGLFDLFRRRATPDSFWKWFAGEAPKFRDVDIKNHTAIDAIGDRLRKVNPDLVFQVGKVDGCWQLEISAGGMRAMMPAVEEMVAAAPPIEGWKVVAYRQPCPGVQIRMGERSYSADSIYFVLRAGTPAELELYLDGFAAAPENVGELAFLLLDAAIGEHAVMTRIGSIDFLDATARPSHARPLRELAAELMN